MDSRILWRAALVQLVAVLLDLHWAGAILAVGLFALWCARLPRPNAACA